MTINELRMKRAKALEAAKAFLESRWEWARPSICGATFEQV